MSFRFPSHKNSNNERAGRRANAKADVVRAAAPTGEQEMERIEQTGAAFINDGKVVVVSYGHCLGYRIQLSPMNWLEVVDNAGFACFCSDSRKLGTCAHIIAAKIFAARETEKQQKIVALRAMISNVINFPRPKVSPCGCRFDWESKFVSEYCTKHWEEHRQQTETECAADYHYSIYMDSAA